MTVLIAMTIAGNYPENIMIGAVKQVNEKFAAFIYLLKDGEIHRLLISTIGYYDDEQAAKDAMKELAISCKKEYAD